MNPCLPILALVVNAAMSSHTLASIEEPSDRARVLVDQLASEDWSQRDQASHELTNFDQEFSLEDLEFFLNDPTLSTEQRARVIQACSLRFRTHPKGGLGVSFGTILTGAIEVVPILNNPGFPASEMLMPGDAIARVDGDLLTSSFDLRAHILSKEPGETLSAVIIRNEQLIELELPLGSFTKLSGAALLEPGLAQRALELRWKRRGISIPDPEIIGSLITIDDWRSAAFPDQDPPTDELLTSYFPTAMIGGIRRLIVMGNYAPRRLRLWKSTEHFNSQIDRNQSQLVGSISRIQRVELALLQRWHDQISLQLSIPDDEHDKPIDREIDRATLQRRLDMILIEQTRIARAIEQLESAHPLSPPPPTEP